MDTIPLFPLNSVLFPKGRISLQIFEARYIDMISNCLKEQTGFGIVLIEAGSEVATTGQKLDIHRTGTYCQIVDWNQLPNGLLGITAEGRSTFRIVQSWREADNLRKAIVAFRPMDSVGAESVEVGEEFIEYVELLRGLANHPAIEELKLDMRLENLREVAWRLSESLPIGNKEKQALLEQVDPIVRLEQIELYLSALNQ